MSVAETVPAGAVALAQLLQVGPLLHDAVCALVAPAGAGVRASGRMATALPNTPTINTLATSVATERVKRFPPCALFTSLPPSNPRSARAQFKKTLPPAAPPLRQLNATAKGSGNPQS